MADPHDALAAALAEADATIDALWRNTALRMEADCARDGATLETTVAALAAWQGVVEAMRQEARLGVFARFLGPVGPVAA